MVTERRISIDLAASMTSVCENHDCCMSKRIAFLSGADGVQLVLVGNEDWMKYISDREYGY